MYGQGIICLLFVSLCQAQNPSWFSACKGFGCKVPNEGYRHSSCVVSDTTESALSRCLTGGTYTHVTFAKSGTIRLSNRIKASDYLIIDGSGKSVVITGAAIWPGKGNLVYRLTFDTGADDALTVQQNHVWIHKCTFKRYGDGLVDITNGCKDITVSFCDFSRHHKTMLIGSNINDVPDRVTIHHNYFHDLVSRQPRIRNAYVHIYNNVFENWDQYAIASSYKGRALVENNWFSSSKNPSQTVRTIQGDDPEGGFVRMKGSRLGSGCVEVNASPEKVLNPTYSYSLDSAGSSLYSKVTSEAGDK